MHQTRFELMKKVHCILYGVLFLCLNSHCTECIEYSIHKKCSVFKGFVEILYRMYRFLYRFFGPKNQNLYIENPTLSILLIKMYRMYRFFLYPPSVIFFSRVYFYICIDFKN